MAVRDCDLLVFHGHLLQETDSPTKHKSCHSSSKFSRTNFSPVPSPCSKPSGKLCLVKSLGCKRCEIHMPRQVSEPGHVAGCESETYPCSCQIKLFPSLSVTSGLEETPQRCHSFVQKLKHRSAGKKASFPREERAGIAQHQLAATQKTSTDTLLRVIRCLGDGYPTTHVDLWVAERTWVQCLFAY